MYKIRNHITLLLSAVLLTGLLLSTVHVHELTHEDVQAPYDTGQVVSPDHNFCPFCGIIFNWLTTGNSHLPVPDTFADYLSFPDGHMAALGHTGVKRGRSPPPAG